MASGPVTLAPQKTLEDPLDYLPCSTIQEFKRGEVIYSQDQQSDSLYLVLSGAVKITRLAIHGREMLLDLYVTDEFFGESSLTGSYNHCEQALSHQTTMLMAWPTAVIEELIVKRPRLAVALLQAFGQRSQAFTQRIESLFFDPIDRRLARSLLRFSERLGTPQPDGSLVMEPLTHELLAQYVGTSREVVTCHMMKFRRLGYLTYSRKSIILYREILTSWLNQRPTA